MPFRIRVSQIILALLAAAVLIVPLLWPVPPLEDTVPLRQALGSDAAGSDATWIDADEVRLHARIRGPGAAGTASDAAPAIVFVHGFASQGGSFVELQDRLADDATRVAYDRPGFGLSERPLSGWDRNPYGHDAQVRHVIAALDRVGAARGVIIGSSAGAGIALRTALEHPARVAGLVLIGPDLGERGGVPPAARWLLFTPQLERLGPLMMRQLGGAQGDALLRASFADPSRLTDSMLERQRRSTRIDDWDRALWEVVQAGRPPRVAHRKAEADVPTLVLSGSEDPVVPPETAERLAADLPRATFETVPGCGHLPHTECSEATAERIEVWLDRTSLAGGTAAR